MERIIDKFILLILSSTLCYLAMNSIYAIIPILVAIIFSACVEWLDNKKVKCIIITLFTLLCYTNNNVIFFIPLICYDLFEFNKMLTLIPFISYLFYKDFDIFVYIYITLNSLLACYMSYRTMEFLKLKASYISSRDKNKENELLLEEKNKHLIDKQNLNIHLAVLNERNRIARDIHDSVGHVISSALIQLGALIVNQKDEKNRESLKLVKTTLDNGMNSIRDSIHDLYDDSIDLENTIEHIIYEFSFCKVAFKFDADNITSNEIKYTVISIIKEALTNVAKHSNATLVEINFREHPVFYQLVVKDNGNSYTNKNNYGIGINNMESRVSNLKGTILVTKDNGFRIFVTIPK